MINYSYGGVLDENKKVVVGIIGILFVAACVIVFAYFRGNAAYVKVKIHSTKEYQKTMRHRL